MKRSSSNTSSSPSSEVDYKPDITPSSNKKSKKTPTQPKPAKKQHKKGEPQKPNGEWDKEKRAVFMDLIIAAGYKAVNLDEIASSLGMGKKQLINQLTPGRKGSFREKAVLAVSGA